MRLSIYSIISLLEHNLIWRASCEKALKVSNYPLVFRTHDIRLRQFSHTPNYRYTPINFTRIIFWFPIAFIWRVSMWNLASLTLPTSQWALNWTEIRFTISSLMTMKLHTINQNGRRNKMADYNFLQNPPNMEMKWIL